MPAAAVPFVLGAVLGARFLWSAVFFADDSESRIVMAVVGLLLGGLPGALYGRWLFGRWGAALLLWGCGWTAVVRCRPRGPRRRAPATYFSR
ncbi:hypothetical protein ACFQ2H_16145 [Streptomyces violaceoruber]